MAQHRLSTSALVQAPATKVYSIIADYKSGHPYIVPKPYFVSLSVEKGGIGAGTVISFQMRLMGKLQTFHATVSEPQPGRVLVETNDNGSVTTFSVEPRDNGKNAYVTISTETSVPNGILGQVQGWLTSQLLRPIYIKELEKLASFATSGVPSQKREEPNKSVSFVDE